MRHEDVLDTVRKNPYSNWLYLDSHRAYVLRSNVLFRIQIRDDLDDTLRSFRQPWTDALADPSAFKLIYDIYYSNAIVDSFILVSVDSGRAALPIPSPQTNAIDRESYLLARAVDDSGTLDQYIKRCKFKVVD